MYLDFTDTQVILMALIFAWAAFVRSGLGFGGIALGMPFMLLVHEEAIFWLPIFGIHVLFFSAITLRNRHKDVDWNYLKDAGRFIFPAALLGIYGLLILPNVYLVTIIYIVTIFYAMTWLLDLAVKAKQGWVEKFMLIFGGYIIGSGMPGMPLISSVFMRFVKMEQLRNTLFVLVSVTTIARLSAFVVADVNLHFYFAIALIPIAWFGHYLGMKAHDYFLRNTLIFRRVIGGGLIFVCSIGLIKLYFF